MSTWGDLQFNFSALIRRFCADSHKWPSAARRWTLRFTPREDEFRTGNRVRRLLWLPRFAEVCMVVSAGKRAENGIYGRQIRLDRSLFVFEA